MARNALIGGGFVQRDICSAVTLRAIRAEASGIAAPDSRHVLVMVGALKRVIAGGMTVHAPRMRQKFSDLGKNRARALCLVCVDSNSDGLLRLWRATDFVSVCANTTDRAAVAEQAIDRTKKNERANIAASPQIRKVSAACVICSANDWPVPNSN
jgi:hypothetical protein